MNMKPATVSDVSYEIARGLIDAVIRTCAERSLTLAAVVVDRGGNLVAASRMDGAQLGAISLATDKAFTAVSFGFPTSAWINASAPGGSDWGLGTTLGGRAIVFPGGVPIRLNGELIGGLGVSGTASEIDEECALAALKSCGMDAPS